MIKEFLKTLSRIGKQDKTEKEIKEDLRNIVMAKHLYNMSRGFKSGKK